MISCGSGWRWTQWWISSPYRPCLCQFIWTGAGWVSLQTLSLFLSFWPSCQSLNPRAVVTGTAQTTNRWDKVMMRQGRMFEQEILLLFFFIIKPSWHGLLSLSVVGNPTIVTKCHGLKTRQTAKMTVGLTRRKFGRMARMGEDLGL